MKRKCVILFCIMLIVFINICYCTKVANIDLFFSIKLGEDVTFNGLSEEDHLTIHDNFKYINVRNLYNLLVYNIYHNWNFFGIYVALAIITSLNSVIIFLLMYKYTKNNVKISLVGTLIALFLMRYYLYMRTIQFSLTIFLIEFYSIRELLYTNKKRYYLSLLLLPILLVNIHGTLFIVYFLFYIPYVIEYIINKTKYKDKIKIFDICEVPQYKNLMIIMIINVFEGLLSPFGLAPYYLPFVIIQGQSIRIISELLPADFIRIIIITGIFGMSFIFCNENTKFHSWLNCLILSILSLLSLRAELYLYTIGIIAIIEIINQYYEDNTDSKIYNARNKVFYLLLIIFTLLGLKNGYKELNNSYVEEDVYPVGATEFILNNLDFNNMRLFNDFNSGSYIEFKGIKAFVDGRSEVFESNYNDTTILKDIVDSVYNEEKGYKEYLDKYDFDYYLVNKKTPLYKKILEDKEFNLQTIYEDDIFIIYK